MVKETKSKWEMEHQVEDAVKAISNAAAEAVKTISAAAQEARSVVAVNAAEAVKVLNVKNADGGSDHDFLLTFSAEVKTKLNAISDDIKELKDGTTTRIDKLEAEKLNLKDSYPILYKAGVDKQLEVLDLRSQKSVIEITRIMTWGSAGVLALGVLQFLISNFFNK